jgi:hypothetical protein
MVVTGASVHRAWCRRVEGAGSGGRFGSLPNSSLYQIAPFGSLPNSGLYQIWTLGAQSNLATPRKGERRIGVNPRWVRVATVRTGTRPCRHFLVPGPSRLGLQPSLPPPCSNPGRPVESRPAGCRLQRSQPVPSGQPCGGRLVTRKLRRRLPGPPSPCPSIPCIRVVRVGPPSRRSTGTMPLLRPIRSAARPVWSRRSRAHPSRRRTHPSRRRARRRPDSDRHGQTGRRAPSPSFRLASRPRAPPRGPAARNRARGPGPYADTAARDTPRRRIAGAGASGSPRAGARRGASAPLQRGRRGAASSRGGGACRGPGGPGPGGGA